VSLCVGSYEKLISGMYMGEIARRVIVQCVSVGCLFDGNDGKLTHELNTPHRFYTKYVSEIEKYYTFSTLHAVHVWYFYEWFNNLIYS